MAGKLTDVHIKNWVRAWEAVAKSDGDGLTFTLSASGTASWTLRYRFSGKHREMTLGRYPDISLTDARKLATRYRASVQQGVDVAGEKQTAKKETARAWTVRMLADDYMTKAATRLAESTISGRRQQLRDYVMPYIGTLPAREVTPADIVDIAERAAHKSLHVARLVLVALREIFGHGIARHVIESDPCAHIKSKHVIGQRPVSRTRIMLTEQELRAVLPALPTIGRQNELMVRILLATATRIGELVGAEWAHIDLERREWTIPPEHSKNGKLFVIPITEQVAGWFSELHPLAFGSRFVLPKRLKRGDYEGDLPMEPTSLNAAINRLCAALGDSCRRFTPHDLRSTARSHFSALGVGLIVAERCLNHSLGGLVGVYDQHDYMTERRAALELWSTFIQACESGKDWNVIPLRKDVV